MPVNILDVWISLSDHFGKLNCLILFQKYIMNNTNFNNREIFIPLHVFVAIINWDMPEITKNNVCSSLRSRQNLEYLNFFPFPGWTDFNYFQFFAPMHGFAGITNWKLLKYQKTRHARDWVDWFARSILLWKDIKNIVNFSY